MNTLAYIVKNGKAIATVMTDLANGTSVKYAFDTCTESLNANREKNLVNARDAKISRAKKWTNAECGTGVKINDGEFLVYE